MPSVQARNASTSGTAGAATGGGQSDSLVDPLTLAANRGAMGMFHAAKISEQMGGVRDDTASAEARSGARLGALRAAGKTVLDRNDEFKNLSKHVIGGDFSTRESGGVLWTGDKFMDGESKISAMKTAQAYAAATDKRTVEMTPGGGALDKYTREEGNSYGDLMSRFAYLGGPDGNFDSAKGLLDSQLDQNSVAGLAGHTVTNDKNPAAMLWDVASRNFASGLTGDTVAVHGYDESEDEALRTGVLAGNTFNRIEKPQVERLGRSNIIETFGTDQDMQPYLRDGSGNEVVGGRAGLGGL